MASSDETPAGGTSRRKFLRDSFLGASALGALGLAPATADAANEGLYPTTKSAAATSSFDFTKASSALQADQIVDSAC